MMTILIRKNKKGVAYITLNRPEVHNAFNSKMIAELKSVFDELNDCPNTHIVVLSGAGPSFSAGADLEWMKKAANYSHDKNLNDAMMLSDMLDAFYRLKQLTITCVHGACMGGALGLVSCSDVSVAERESNFGFSEVKIGLIPATISPFVIKAIGANWAKRYFQTGEAFSTETALRIGLIHQAFNSESEREKLIDDLINKVAANSPQAMKDAKKLVLNYDGLPITDEVRHDSAKRIVSARSSIEGQEGLNAFLNKRKPDWKKDV